MSSILKALKKVEDEKAARTPDQLRIDSEILRGDDRGRPSAFVITLAAVALLACGAAASYMLLKPSAGGVPQPVTAPAAAQKQLAEKVVTPPIAPLSTDTGQSAAARPLPPPATVSDNRKAAATPPVRSAASAPVTRSVRPPSVVPEPRQQLTQSAIIINGIAYQDDGESVAVVNGLPVSAGSVVAGAHVEEIKKDRVQFSRNGERFEVMLEKTQ